MKKTDNTDDEEYYPLLEDVLDFVVKYVFQQRKKNPEVTEQVLERTLTFLESLIRKMKFKYVKTLK